MIIQIIDNVGTGRDLSDKKTGTEKGFDIKTRTTRELSLRKSLRRIKSISEIIGSFKTTSSKLIHQSGGHDFLLAAFILRPHHPQ